jgi:hypothetical protein
MTTLSGRPSGRRPSERLLVVVAALVQPLFQVQLPACIAVPVLAVAAVAALWR